MSEEDEKRESRLRVRLTKKNWNSEFRQQFVYHAMTVEKAGDIILFGHQMEMDVPRRDMNRPILDANGSHERDGPPGRAFRYDGERAFRDDQRGDALYRIHEENYTKLRNGKRTLIKRLLTSMDREVLDAVTVSEGYDRALMEADLFTMWNIAEQVTTGRGAASVYGLITKLLQLKQEGLRFIAFEKEFKDTTRELTAQGTAEEREQQIFNALFVMGVNQEQFKTRLNVIYGTRVWPGYNELAEEFQQFAESTERINELRGVKTEAIAAHTAKAGGGPSEESRVCWNCLSGEHLARDCQKPRRKCGNCGRMGHHEKFCREGTRTTTVPVERSKGYERRNERTGMKKKGSTRERMIRQFTAKLAELAEEEDSEGREDDDDEITEDDEAGRRGFMVKCDLQGWISSEKTQAETTTCDLSCWKWAGGDEDENGKEKEEAASSMVAMMTDGHGKEEMFIIDSGCRGAHVIKSGNVLGTRIEASRRGRRPTVESASGHHMVTSEAGTISSIDGVALVTPETSSNLLSLMEMVKHNGGSFNGNKDEMIVKDRKGRVILKGLNRGDDFWSCTSVDLQKGVTALAGDVGQATEEEEEEQEENPSEELTDTTQVQDLKTHLTAEERRRAEEAYSLCARFRHPGTKSLLELLDHSLIPGCYLTGQDLRNARSHIGRCPACVEGKMRAPSDRASTAEPADKIGGRVYIDLVPLSSKSIGGNTMLCIAIDEKSSYGICIPMKSKKDSDIRDLGIELLAEFNTHKHRVDRICTDDETCFRVWRTQLGAMGVSVSATPAGFHCKRVERYIQTIKARRRAMLAGLFYELPAELEAESFVDAIYWSNAVPNTSTGAQTSPSRLFTGMTSFMPDIPFGSYGLFFRGRSDQKTKAMWGVFLGYGSNKKYMRVYDPTTKRVQAHYKFENLGTEAPSAWGFKPRIRPPDRTRQADPVSRLPFIQSDNAPIQQRDRRHGEERNASEGAGNRASEGAGNRASEGAGSRASEGDEATGTGTSEAQDVLMDNSAAIEAIDPPSVPSTMSIIDNPTVPTAVINQPVPMESGPRPKKSKADTVPTVDVSTAERRSSSRNAHGTWRDGPVKYRTKENQSNSVTITALVAQVARACVACRHLRVKKSWKDGEGEAMKKLDKFKESPKIKLAEVMPVEDVTTMWNAKALRASLKQAMKDEKRRGAILASIYAEIDNLEQPGVMTPIEYRDIPRNMRQHIVGVYMFHKEKYKADGTFDKDKTRLVLLSNLRQEETIGETYCPTVNPMSVMTQLNLAAVRKETVISAYDIKGAFLLTKMDDRRMFIRVGPDIVRYWVERVPERRQLVHEDGCLYFELNRYVYGLHEAPRKFNGMLDQKLRKMGLKPTKADPCLYTKGKEIILSVHVDDMLLTASSLKIRDWFENEIKKSFEIVAQHDNVSYLGMTVTRESDGSVRVDQRGFLEALLRKLNYSGDKHRAPNTPSTPDLTRTDPQSPRANKTEYLSLVMSLMYLARFTRPDILFSLSYLATRSSEPSMDDLAKLHRVARYLSGTLGVSLRFDSRVTFKPKIYSDASHHLYETGHGQQSLLITNGSGPVGCRSTKIKMITRSSSESELVSLEEASTYAVWYALLLFELGCGEVKPIKIYQDNKSTMVMAAVGPTFRRTKHIIGKRSYIQERLAEGEVTLGYVPTRDMLADILTKPLPPAMMRELMFKLGLTIV